MSLWEERAARNEALFREVNEQVRTLTGTFAAVGGDASFVCECSDDGCAERLQLPLDVYEAVRANPRRFFVVPGHEDRFERVVERASRYAVVEKEGTAGQIAEQMDPRE
jgi:hypothetical protein